MRKRIFVSGGNGVIGNALVKKLHERGAELLVGDLKPTPRHWPAAIQYRRGDLNYITKRELEAFRPQVFMHLAATFERSEETYDFWGENDHHNARLSHHLMDLLRDADSLETVVFASSYLIYDPDLYLLPTPPQRAVRLTEQSRIRPRNLCGMAKLFHEAELEFIKQFRPHLQVAVPRIYRSYGYHSRDIISRWIRSLLDGEALTVYQPEGMFDYVFAEDVAEGLIRIVEHGVEGVVNLGADDARSVSDVLRVLKTHFPDMRMREVPSDLPFEASQANMSLMEKKTGWRPRTRLENAIPLMIAEEQRQRTVDRDAQGPRVLVTSVSAEIPQVRAIRDAINKIAPGGDVHGGDVNDRVLARHFVDEFWKMPLLQDLSLDSLVQYCRDHRITAIVPTRDGELEYFATHRDQLQCEGVHAMVSDAATVSLCVDKLRFADECARRGFPVVPASLDAATLACTRFVVKERFGAGSRSIGLDLDLDAAVRHATALINPIFQPYVTGQEISIDAYITRQGDVKGCVLRSRDLVMHGQSQVTTLFNDPALEQLAHSILSSFAFYGHVMLQVIIDVSGRYHLIECNSRFGGASTLSIAAGLDSFYWFLLESLGEDIRPYPFVRSTGPLKQVRYSADMIL